MDTISAAELQRCLFENTINDNVLVLDTRPYISYNKKRILGANNMYCPPILKRRFSKGGKLHLESMLNSETRNKLMSGHFSCIVIYGEGENLQKDTNNDLQIVWHSLDQLGFGDICHVLEGGFENFEKRFPQLCTSPEDSEGVISYPPEPTALEKSQRHALFRTNSTLADPVELLPYLYIGNAYSAASENDLQRFGITAILNVSSTCKNHFTSEFLYKNIPVDDNSGTQLSAWFKDAISFIDDVKLGGGKTLVHCHAGVSRSATICLAYIMYNNKISLDSAFEFVRSRRNEISPNAGFMHQLLEFEKEIDVREANREVLSPPSSPHCRFYSVSSSFCSSMDTSLSSPFTTPFSSPTALCSPMTAFT